MNNQLILASTGFFVFESLPDEILLDIFEYVSIQDLYYGFYSLNYRFRMILASLKSIYGETMFNQELKSAAFRFFASRIITLNIRHADFLDISPFVIVRSLTLHIEPTRIQCQSIQILHHLKYLYISQRPVDHYYYSVSLPSFVFTNCYPTLHTCQLNLVSYKIRQDWTSISSLHTLSICVENPRVFIQILQSCPFLSRLKIELTPHFNRPPTRFDVSSHKYLRRLYICLNQTMFSCCEAIEVFLCLVPNLTDLTIQGPSSIANSINIHVLADILQQYVPALQHFKFDMLIEESIARLILEYGQQQIAQLHPLFNKIRIYPSTQKVPLRLLVES